MSFILKQFKYVFIKKKLSINLNLHCNKCSWIHVIDYCLDPDFTRCLLLPLVVHRLVWGLQLAPSCEGALRWTGKEFQTLTRGHLIKSKWTLISDSKYTLDCLCWKCKMSLYWISARRNVRAALGSCSTCSWRLQSSQLGNRGIQNNNTKKKIQQSELLYWASEEESDRQKVALAHCVCQYLHKRNLRSSLWQREDWNMAQQRAASLQTAT